MIVLCATRLYTPQEVIEAPLLFIEDGVISAVSSQAERDVPRNATVINFTDDLGDAILVPGFVDIHMHGGAGLDVMQAGTADLPHLHKFLTSHGVTSYFPTTVAAPLDQTCAALERIADAIDASQNLAASNGDGVQARPLGVHLEGPFLSQNAAECIPRNSWLSPRWEFLNDSGKPRAATCA
jgi:N-acetylglucosamine-6-phosphate deacetylase